VDLYAQQVGRSARDGYAAVCLLFFSSEDLEPVRRAAACASVSLHDTCVTSNVVVEELGTSGLAFVPRAAFVSRGVAAVRIPTALRLLASASLFFLGTQTHEHSNVLRGPAWSCPPASLSADAAHVLYTCLFPSYAKSGSVFASYSMATLEGRPHFSRYGIGATKAVVGALEELLQTAQFWPIRTRTQALMCFQTFLITPHLYRIYPGMFHSKSASKLN